MQTEQLYGFPVLHLSSPADKLEATEDLTDRSWLPASDTILGDHLILLLLLLSRIARDTVLSVQLEPTAQQDSPVTQRSAVVKLRCTCTCLAGHKFTLVRTASYRGLLVELDGRLFKGR